MAVASFSTAFPLALLLSGEMSFNPRSMSLFPGSMVLKDTLLFNMTGYRPSADDLNSTLVEFSLSPVLQGDLSAGPQELCGNVTLALVNEHMATTHVDAMVTPNSTENQYVSWKLSLIYGVVFGFSLVVIAYGLFCLRRNGTIAIFDLQHIMEMTATSVRLHEAAAHPEFGSTPVGGIITSEPGLPFTVSVHPSKVKQRPRNWQKYQIRTNPNSPRRGQKTHRTSVQW
ncbi:hypothetical protein D9757_013172 [Collybiopsis confluens]|uniref:Uncharacterized protein n=1 Tax=Collybiopsis confluens TaxID=2823264 RepID=A0A8H5FYQ2_9AGAR|nr:hypothetical protein D9757_013172 [Collybiopsis confluens]